MSGRSDIEHLQELVDQLSPEDAELFNRLERTRLTVEFMLAGIRRPSTQKDIEHDGSGGPALSERDALPTSCGRTPTTRAGTPSSDGRSACASARSRYAIIALESMSTSQVMNVCR